MSLSMKDILLGKEEEGEDFHYDDTYSSSCGIGKQQAINIVTSYTDEIPTGEAAKNTMTILIKTKRQFSLA